MKSVAIGRRFGASIVVLLMLGVVPASIADPGGLAPQIGEVAVGFGGWFKVGKWTPVRVEVIVSGPGRLRLDVAGRDPTGHLLVFEGVPQEFAAAGPHVLWGLFQSGSLTDSLEVHLLRETDEAKLVEVASRTLRVQALRQSVSLWIAVGHPAGLEADPSGSRRIATYESLDGLPTDPVAWDGVDTLLLAAGGPQTTGRSFEADEPTDRALEAWVRSGGHLIMAVGDLEAYRGSRLSQWIPVPVDDRARMLPDSDLSKLVVFAPGNVPIKFVGRLPAVLWRPTDGRVWVETLSGPLLVEVACGLGRVTVLGVDIDRPPLSTWEALPSFLDQVARNGRGGLRSSQTASGGKVSHTGITDLKTQLHAVQEHFEEVRRVPIWQVMLLVVVYLLVVGPLDYLVVHRWLGRPRLTWLTLPTVVVVGVTVSAWAAGATNGREPLANQLDVVDIDVASGQVRVHSWMTLYAPESRQYDVSVKPTWPAAGGPVRVCWSGTPEKGFGGMYRPAGFGVGRVEYRLAPAGNLLAGLPVPIWSAQSVVTRWEAQAELAIDDELTSRSIGELRGRIEFDRLPWKIDDWILAFRNRVYRADGRRYQVLGSGSVLRPGSSAVRGRDLGSFLTGRVTRRVVHHSGVGTDVRKSLDRYDPRNTDPKVLIRMLTFHEAAGGRGYTDLDNHDLSRLDLSMLLDLDRAVLVGRLIADPAGGPASVARPEIRRHGSDDLLLAVTRSAAYVRMVFPVHSSKATYEDLPPTDR